MWNIHTFDNCIISTLICYFIKQMEKYISIIFSKGISSGGWWVWRLEGHTHSVLNVLSYNISDSVHLYYMLFTNPQNGID